jgi:ABC-type oligopeptide transport system ATPase subunit
MLHLVETHEISRREQCFSNAEQISSSAQLSIRNVTKVFPGKNGLFDRMTGKAKADFMAIQDISMEIEPNTFVTIIGPSGCGKSTLLGMIAGLSDITQGEILLNGHHIAGPGPDRGMVFPELCSDALDDGGRKHSLCRGNGASQNVSQGDEPHH